jgi:hypothetical protein
LKEWILFLQFSLVLWLKCTCKVSNCFYIKLINRNKICFFCVFFVSFFLGFCKCFYYFLSFFTFYVRLSDFKGFKMRYFREKYLIMKLTRINKSSTLRFEFKRKNFEKFLENCEFLESVYALKKVICVISVSKSMLGWMRNLPFLERLFLQWNLLWVIKCNKLIIHCQNSEFLTWLWKHCSPKNLMYQTSEEFGFCENLRLTLKLQCYE